MRPLVYLAGPITGLSYDEATNWRAKVRQALLPDIESASPMRGKEDLANEVALQDAYLSLMSNDQTIVRRDLFDVRRADALFVNLLGAQRPSIGTVAEMAIAFDRNIPIVMAMEEHGNPHEHGFIRVFAPFRVTSLPEAVDVIRTILLSA